MKDRHLTDLTDRQLQVLAAIVDEAVRGLDRWLTTTEWQKERLPLHTPAQVSADVRELRRRGFVAEQNGERDRVSRDYPMFSRGYRKVAEFRLSRDYALDLLRLHSSTVKQ